MLLKKAICYFKIETNFLKNAFQAHFDQLLMMAMLNEKAHNEVDLYKLKHTLKGYLTVLNPLFQLTIIKVNFLYSLLTRLF
jgi:hypothetical protein